jgi:inorganic triphosphatase YgiF
MFHETEIKLRIPNENVFERIKAHIDAAPYRQSEPVEYAMKAVYYDTPGHDLERRKWSLRVRDEGGVSVGTFKSEGTAQGGVFTREE